MSTTTATVEASTRDLILDAAEDLMTHAGYENASIARICRDSGQTVGSLYHYFGSKAGLLTAIFPRCRDRFFNSLPVLDEQLPLDETHLERDLLRHWRGAVEGIIANLGFFMLDVELVRLSNLDPELKQFVTTTNAATRQHLAATLLPFTRAAGASDPEHLSHELSHTITTFTRGAIITAGTDHDVLRTEMDRLLTAVRARIVEAAGSST